VKAKIVIFIDAVLSPAWKFFIFHWPFLCPYFVYWVFYT